MELKKIIAKENYSCFYRSPLLNPVLSQMNPIHILSRLHVAGPFGTLMVVALSKKIPAF
jgi:hypothetical protein